MRGFSDFFEAIFGARGEDPNVRFGGGAGFGGRGHHAAKGENFEVDLTVPLQDVLKSAQCTVSLGVPTDDDFGRAHIVRKSFQLRIPPGTTEGSVIRLAGQGAKDGAATPGDLLLKVRVAPHPQFELHGFDLHTQVKVTPWEAGLGAKVPLSTLEGELKVAVPPGATSGSVLRLRGKGLPKSSKERGDLLVELEIHCPPTLNSEEKALFEKLQSVSKFDPRR
jgi:curved DNA-binding protein